MAPPVGILGPVPAIRGLGFAWKQTGLGAPPGDFTPRAPLYAVRVNVDWRVGDVYGVSPGQLLPPFNQLYWPLTPAARQIDRSITESFNLDLIGQDQLPAGTKVFDLPPTGPVYSNILRAWTQSLLQSTLIPSVALPPGGQVFDRAQPGPIQPLRDWSLNLLESTLAPPPVVINYQPRTPVHSNPREYPYHVQLRSWASTILPYATITPTQNPFFQTSWPIAPPPVQPDRSVAAAYNPNLIGKDQLPVGARFTDLWTKTPESPTQTRSWVWSYNLNLIGQDKLPAGGISTALTTKPHEHHVQLRTWGWSYNLNLVGQDQLPIGKIIYDRPALLALALFQTWINSTNIALTTVPQNPFYQTSWPLTPAAQQPERTIAASYNLNLIGQDKLPTGEQISDRPPLAAAGIFQTWSSSINLNLIVQIPFRQTDWPLTSAARQPERTVTVSYNLNLIGQDLLPFNQKDWPNPTPPYRQPQLSSWIDQVKFLLQVPFKQLDWPVPYGPRQPAQSFTGSYNLNLIGQDQLPVGAKVSDIPPQPPLSAIQLRTWIQSVNLALTVVPPKLPFNQYDWPINTGPRQPTQLFYATFNKNLIGQDKLPAGKNVYDLPPRGPAPLVQVWLQGFSQFRPATIILYPHNQFDWPVPRGAWDGKDRTIATRSQFLQPVVPPPSLPNVEAPPVRDFWDRDEWGNFIKGYCVRGT